ncbi:hypothetical protein HN873_056401 [Arachis hypogaea]
MEGIPGCAKDQRSRHLDLEPSREDDEAAVANIIGSTVVTVTEVGTIETATATEVVAIVVEEEEASVHSWRGTRMENGLRSHG